MQACAHDMSDFTTIRIAGYDAERFIFTMYSGNLCPIKQLEGLSSGLFLNSEGEIIDAVFVVRSGKDEFLVLSTPGNGEELTAWLVAHAEISLADASSKRADDASSADAHKRLFPNLDVHDYSDMLSVFMLYGNGSKHVFNELQKACERRIPLIVCSVNELVYGIPSVPAWIVFAPINAADQIGDFIASFPQLEVVTRDEFKAQLKKTRNYASELSGVSYVKPCEIDLEYLMRSSGDFVGARALGLRQ